MADHLTGGRDRARAHLEEGSRSAAVAAPLVQVLCLPQLGVLALDKDDGQTAELCVARARTHVERVGRATTRSARWRSRRRRSTGPGGGRVDDAHRDLQEGARLLAALRDFTPWYEAETRVLLARAALRLSDVVRARTLPAEASRLARPVPDAALLSDWLDGSWVRADSFSSAAILGPSSLTTAELRVMQLLPTHLSFREIARRLHVSANTIKTQAHAIYR